MSLQGIWYGYWNYWNLYHKVTFDGANKLIIVNYGVTDLNIQQDVYSDWKEWIKVDDNLKFEAALRTVGGDPTVGDSAVGRYFFLINGWRMRTWEGNHELNLDGNIFVDGGGSLFVPTIRPWTTQTSILRSNLTEVVIISGSSEVVSGTFTSADRIILQRIDEIAQNLPNSGSLTDIQNGINTISSDLGTVTNAIAMASAVVTSPGTSTVTTTLTANDHIFDDMFVAISSGSYKVVRKIDTYLATSGTITFDVALPFTAISGSGVTILPGYNPTNGRIG